MECMSEQKEHPLMMFRQQDNPRRSLPAPLVGYFIIRFRGSLFLYSYTNQDGILATADLQKAKLFSAPPISAVDVFQAEILTVLVNADGSGVRRTLLDRATAGRGPYA
jgi:hypothetical protein